MVKLLTMLEATRQRCHDNRHASVANRPKIKCLQVVNEYNNPVTLH
jgi:hypothetical protein